MQQQPNEDVTDIIIDDTPAPVEVDELPSVHDREFSLPSSPPALLTTWKPGHTLSLTWSMALLPLILNLG